MKNLLNPKWLLLINTVPTIILLFLFYQEFTIIKSLLDTESLLLWKTFGYSLLGIGIASLCYSIIASLLNKKISIYYSLLALQVYVVYLYLYYIYSETLMPSFTIPSWMASEYFMLYAGTFLMPTLIYSLLTIAMQFTNDGSIKNSKTQFYITIAIPILWYIFGQIILPLWQPVEDVFNIHVIFILIILFTVVFLFFVISGLYVLASRKSFFSKKFNLAWKIPIALILPLLGLFLNNYNNHSFINNDYGFLGNFSNIWFYIITIFNGIVICLPDLKNNIYRLILYFFRSIGFAFTTYFFIIFMPYIPVSVAAIILIGLGILLLSPFFLFFITIQELHDDYLYLKQYFQPKLIILISIIGFLVIPSSISGYYLSYKKELTNILEYLYKPDYSKQYTFNTLQVKECMSRISKHKRSNRMFLTGNETPYLTAYFNWLVLDNLTLSDNKMNYINEVFFGEKKETDSFISGNDHWVYITDIKTRSSFDQNQQAWITWVDMEIFNDNTQRNSEYSTIIQLPQGCWVSDYYLYVNDSIKHGILTEKKTALWVYSQITNENRDPGLLYYLNGNKLAFKVFPFANYEKRKTGIQFIHKEPITLKIDTFNIKLGNENEIKKDALIETDFALFIPSSYKSKLKKVKREPYLHFIVDVSVNQKNKVDIYSKNINNICNKYSNLSKNAKISFANSYSKEYTINDDWKNIYKNYTFEGGFFVDYTIRKILIEAYKANLNTYPIFVLVTDSIENAIINNNFIDIEFSYPESDKYFQLTNEGTLNLYSLSVNSYDLKKNLAYINAADSVYLYTDKENKKWYIRDDSTASVLIKRTVNISTNTIQTPKLWLDGLEQQAAWVSQIIKPETSDKEWTNLVSASFKSKIMTPLTSYIVVENKAQEAMIKRKQAQALSGNNALDLGEETVQMSEPELWWLLAVLVLFLAYSYYKKRKIIV
ncbi:MAG: MSEP-CTERM sorting domain-containing protein [Bacteroidales bacterium]|nr:MSEP-CTERM sorting domain-containing protein [Bacteroidales bacterium]